MSDNYEIRGAEQYAKAHVALDHEADELPRHVVAGIRSSLDTARIVREGASDLPVGGGLRARVEGYPAHLDTNSRGATLRIDRVAGLNAGRLRHPVYGNHDVIVEQDVPKGGFDRALEHAAERVKTGVAEQLERANRETARKV